MPVRAQSRELEGRNNLNPPGLHIDDFYKEGTFKWIRVAMGMFH